MLPSSSPCHSSSPSTQLDQHISSTLLKVKEKINEIEIEEKICTIPKKYLENNKFQQFPKLTSSAFQGVCFFPSGNRLSYDS